MDTIKVESIAVNREVGQRLAMLEADRRGFDALRVLSVKAVVEYTDPTNDLYGNKSYEVEIAGWAYSGPRCESGWTGDRCDYPLGHEGEHSNP